MGCHLLSLIEIFNLSEHSLFCYSTQDLNLVAKLTVCLCVNCRVLQQQLLLTFHFPFMTVASCCSTLKFLCFYVLGIWHWVTRCSWNPPLWNSSSSSGKHFVPNQSELYQLCTVFVPRFGVFYVLRCCSTDLSCRQWLFGSLLPLCAFKQV